VEYVFTAQRMRSPLDLQPAIRRQSAMVRFQPEPLQASGFYLTGTSQLLPDYQEFQIEQHAALPPVKQARRSVVDAVESAAKAERQLELQELWWAISDQVLQVLALQSEVEVLEGQKQAYAEIQAAIQLRKTAGESVAMQLEQANWALAHAVTEWADFKNQLQAGMMQLETWSGGTLPALRIAAGGYGRLDPLTVQAFTGFEEEAVATAISLAEAEWKLAQSEKLPEWTLGYNTQGVSGERYGGVYAGLAIPLRRSSRAMELASLEKAFAQKTGDLEVEAAQLQRKGWAQRYATLLEVRPIWVEALDGMRLGEGLDLAAATQHFTVIEIQRMLTSRYEAERELIHLDMELRRLRARLLTPQEMPQP